MADASALRSLIEQTLRFHWYQGGVTMIGSHSTGWRDRPSVGVVQIQDLRTTLELVDRQPLQGESGDAFVIDAQTSHCFTSTTVATKAIGCCRWSGIDFHILGGISVLSLFSVPLLVHGELADLVGSSCARLAELHARSATGLISQVVQRNAIGMPLLAQLLAISEVNERGHILLTHATRLQAVLGWIDEHLDQEASRESLARLAQLSPSRFHALFQQVMRGSPMAYLAQRRMQRAQQLLMTTAQQVKDIAAAVGYGDPNHFSRVFKRATGDSPLHYRSRSRLWLQQAAGKEPSAAT